MNKKTLKVRKSREIYHEKPMTAHEYDKIADHKLPSYVRCVVCRKPPLDNNWLKVDRRDPSGRTMIHLGCVDQTTLKAITNQAGRG